MYNTRSSKSPSSKTRLRYYQHQFHNMTSNNRIRRLLIVIAIGFAIVLFTQRQPSVDVDVFDSLVDEHENYDSAHSDNNDYLLSSPLNGQGQSLVSRNHHQQHRRIVNGQPLPFIHQQTFDNLEAVLSGCPLSRAPLPTAQNLTSRLQQLVDEEIDLEYKRDQPYFKLDGFRFCRMLDGSSYYANVYLEMYSGQIVQYLPKDWLEMKQSPLINAGKSMDLELTTEHLPKAVFRSTIRTIDHHAEQIFNSSLNHLKSVNVNWYRGMAMPEHWGSIEYMIRYSCFMSALGTSEMADYVVPRHSKIKTFLRDLDETMYFPFLSYSNRWPSRKVESPDSTNNSAAPSPVYKQTLHFSPPPLLYADGKILKHDEKKPDAYRGMLTSRTTSNVSLFRHPDIADMLPYPYKYEMGQRGGTRSPGGKPLCHYKIAYVIFAHDRPDNLKMLIKSLMHPEAFITIHVDANHPEMRAEVMKLVDEYFGKPANIYVMEYVFDLVWAHVSLVWVLLEAAFQLMDMISFDYLVNLSGFDYPIKTTEGLYSQLVDTGFKGWLPFFDAAHPKSNKGINKFTQYFPGFIFQRMEQGHIHVARDRAGEGQFWLPGRRPSVFYQLFPDVVKHSQWMALPRPLLDYFRRSPKARIGLGWMEHSFIPDEHYFGLLLYNSEKLKAELSTSSNERIVFWPGPQWLNWKDHYKKLVNLLPSAWFCRKLDLKKERKLKEWIDRFREERELAIYQ